MLGKLNRDKYSKLLKEFANYGNKMLITLAPDAF
jgi:hypothetical protein